MNINEIYVIIILQYNIMSCGNYIAIKKILMLGDPALEFLVSLVGDGAWALGCFEVPLAILPCSKVWQTLS